MMSSLQQLSWILIRPLCPFSMAYVFWSCSRGVTALTAALSKFDYTRLITCHLNFINLLTKTTISTTRAGARQWTMTNNLLNFLSLLLPLRLTIWSDDRRPRGWSDHTQGRGFCGGGDGFQGTHCDENFLVVLLFFHKSTFWWIDWKICERITLERGVKGATPLLHLSSLLELLALSLANLI